jgi:hypothetical protein
VFEYQVPCLSYDLDDRVGEAQRNFRRIELAVNPDLPQTVELTTRMFMNLHKQLREEVAKAVDLATVQYVKDDAWAEILRYTDRKYNKFDHEEIGLVRPRIEDLVSQLIQIRDDVQFYRDRKNDFETNAKRATFRDLHHRLCKEMEQVQKHGVQECLQKQSVIDIMEYVKRDHTSFNVQEIDTVESWFEATVTFLASLNQQAQLYCDWKVDAKPAEKWQILAYLHRQFVKRSSEMATADLPEHVK